MSIEYNVTFCKSDTDKMIKMVFLVVKENNIEMFILKLRTLKNVIIGKIMVFSFHKPEVRRCKIIKVT